LDLVDRHGAFDGGGIELTPLLFGFMFCPRDRLFLGQFEFLEFAFSKSSLAGGIFGKSDFAVFHFDTDALLGVGINELHPAAHLLANFGDAALYLHHLSKVFGRIGVEFGDGDRGGKRQRLAQFDLSREGQTGKKEERNEELHSISDYRIESPAGGAKSGQQSPLWRYTENDYRSFSPYSLKWEASLHAARLFLPAVFIAVSLPGADWPQFRGPNRDAVSTETGLLRSWPAGGPKVLWTVPVGQGYAGAAIVAGRVYHNDYDEAKGEWAVIARSLANGKELWRFAEAKRIRPNHAITRTVPAVDGRFVFSIDPKCEVHAFDARTGKQIWSKDLVAIYKTKIPPWYNGQNPLLEADRIVIATGGDALLVALDKATGKELWRTPNTPGAILSHASVMPAMIAGVKQYLYATLEGLYGVINQYVVTTRGENQTVNGQDMAVFTTTFDLAGLLASPELPGAIITFLNDPAMSEAFAGTDVSTVTETQVQFVLMTAGLVLEESSFTMEQWIGLDDLFIHKSQGSMALTVDVGSLAGESAEPQSFAISGSFNIELDQFNAVTPDAVTIPENYLALEDTSNFMVGTPDMIRQALTIGEPVTASFTTDENQHVYSVNLPADSAVEVLLESEGYPYMKVYDPDGFLVEEYDAYFDDSLIFTAEEDGLYLVVVNSYWEEEYTLTVQLRE